MNSHKRITRSISLAFLTLGLLSSSAYAQQANIMQGRIWDFSSAHPDFETGRGGPIVTGQVASTLGEDGKPVWAGSPNQVFASKEAFDQWYRDVPGINMSSPYVIELVESPVGSGNYSFDRRDFFPIDDQLLGNEDGRFTDTQGRPHNFHYTMQLAGEFSFQNDSDTFTFTGDDDLWVFFGGQLGIDLGGPHRSATVSITGAQLRELGLNPGQSYAIDVFFAERQSQGSNFTIETNFNIQPPAPERIPVGEVISDANMAEPQAQLLPRGTELVRGERYWSPSGEHFLTLNPDGNLVVARADGGYVWGFDTQGVDFPRVGSVIYQDDGNLAAYAEDGSYLWSALHTTPDPDAQLVFRPNGALQIAAGENVLWTSIPYEPENTVAGETTATAPLTSPADDLALLTQTDTGPVNMAWGPAAPGEGVPVAFVSTDGTAWYGSRSVFILTNQATGQSTLVPVEGADEATRTVVNLAPGTYTVTPPAPSIGQFASFLTTKVSETQITIPEGSAAGGALITVEFSLDSRIVPVGLFVDEVTADRVVLSWDTQPGVDVAEYVLVQTNGRQPAESVDVGTIIPLDGPTATSALADGLMPSSIYTFALFSTSTSGEVLPVRSFTTTTANPGTTDAAFALAPNAIVPSDFERLGAERVGETWVRVQLDPQSLDRASASAYPGVDPRTTEGGACVVGAPFLVTTDVAGDNSFYGLIDVCEISDLGVSTAIVNTKVPLNTIFSYYHISSGLGSRCYDPVTVEELTNNEDGCLIGAEETSEGDTDVVHAAAPEPGNGDVTVTLLWQGGDDLDLQVIDPLGAAINWQDAASTSGGWLDADDRGADCRFLGKRAENISWPELAPSGTYAISVTNHKACGPAPEAQIQVRVNGDLVIESPVSPDSGQPILFRVDGDSASLVLPGYRAGNGVPTDSFSSLATAPIGPLLPSAKLYNLAFPPRLDTLRAPTILVAQAGSKAANLLNQYSEADSMRKIEFEPSKNIKCEGVGNARFDLRTRFGPIFDHDVKIEGATLKWNIRAGVEAGINPDIEFAGEMTCEVETTEWSTQLSYYPIPITLSLAPAIEASATAKLTIDGPKLDLALGVQSEGEAWGSLGWFKVKVSVDHTTTPFATFKRGPVEATLQGTLGFGVGVNGKLGVGTKNLLTDISGGLSLGLYPLAAEIKAVTGTSNCLAASVGGKIDVGLYASAFVVGFGGSIEKELYESDVISYPGAEFELGSCPED